MIIILSNKTKAEHIWSWKPFITLNSNALSWPNGGAQIVHSSTPAVEVAMRAAKDTM